MAPGCGECASIARYLHRSTGDDRITVLADMQVPGSIHFHKTLAQKSQCQVLSRREAGTVLCSSPKLRLDRYLPVWFVKEHGDKFEDWVILRTLSSSKPWRVRLRVARTASGAPNVGLIGGWSRFVLDNRLKEGDSLLFALNVDARSEFRVYIFPSAQLSKVVAPSHRRGIASNSIPSFRRWLVQYKGQWAKYAMEVPAVFVRAHGMPEQLRDVVELQGVHQESPVRTVTCQWYKHEGGRTIPRLFFTEGWDAFAKENGLEVGQELQFTLTSHSFFVVRVVV